MKEYTTDRTYSKDDVKDMVVELFENGGILNGFSSGVLINGSTYLTIYVTIFWILFGAFLFNISNMNFTGASLDLFLMIVYAFIVGNNTVVFTGDESLEEFKEKFEEVNV